MNEKQLEFIRDHTSRLCARDPGEVDVFEAILAASSLCKVLDKLGFFSPSTAISLTSAIDSMREVVEEFKKTGVE